VEAVSGQIPPAVLVAAPLHQQFGGRDPATQRGGILAVAGEDVVVAAKRGDRANLRDFLPERLQPQAQLALSLECDGLVVEAAGHRHSSTEVAAQLRRDLQGPLRIGAQSSIGAE
jgi:hypothetical protein